MCCTDNFEYPDHAVITQICIIEPYKNNSMKMNCIFLKTGLTVLLIMICSGLQLRAQSVNFSWAKAFVGGILSADYSGADCIVNSSKIDSSGNIITAGSFKGGIDFDPGPGVFKFTDTANYSIFVTKLDSAGSFLWARQVKASIKGISLDDSGNIYITGTFSGTVDFDPGITVHNLTATGSNNLYILKLKASGDFGWVAHIQGGSSITLNASAITVDRGRNVYATGQFNGTVDFNPGPATFNLTSDGFYSYSSISYVLKMDSSGAFVWAKKICSGARSCESKAITADQQGNVWVTGVFSGANVDFDPGSGTHYLGTFPVSQNDIYMVKLDSGGNFARARQIGGGEDEDEVTAIISDDAGNIYLTGQYFGAVDFNRGGSSHILSAPGGSVGMFIAKYDTAGVLNWARSFGEFRNVQCWDIAVDGNQEVYATGDFRLTVDFDPGSGIYNLTERYGNSTQLQRSIYVLKLDSAGNFGWAHQMENLSSNHDYGLNSGRSINVDPAGRYVYTSGNYWTPADFDPGTDTFRLAGVGGPNARVFIQKMNRCTGTGSSVTASSCDSFSLNGITYYLSGTYTQGFHNASGCDSFVTLDLDIHNTSMGSITETACGSFTLHDTTYTESGAYTQLLQSTAGCDSFLTINLTILNVDDRSVTVNDDEGLLIANAKNAGYQWIDCELGAPIQGATGKGYIADKNGRYAVIITQSACTDTSDCYQISGITSVKDMDNDHTLKVFPNPSSGKFTLLSDILFSGANIVVTNTLGQVVYRESGVYGTAGIIDISAVQPGLYFMEIYQDGERQRIKLVKE